MKMEIILKLNIHESANISIEKTMKYVLAVEKEFDPQIVVEEANVRDSK